jgi:hypothetical protein
MIQIQAGPSVQKETGPLVNSAPQIDQKALAAPATLAKAASGLSATIGKIQDDARDQADQLAVLDRRKTFEEAKTAELFGPSGALMAKGKNAFEASNKAKESLSKKAQELASDLNENQKFLFNQYLDDEQNDISQRLTVHTAREISNYDDNLTEASINGLRERALTDFSNPNLLAKNLADQEILIRQAGKRKGLPDEAVDLAVLNQKSVTHIGVISKLAANQMDIGATKYFKAVKGQMTEEDQLKATRMLEESSFRGESQRIVDGILGKGGSLSDGLEETKKIKNPKLREEAENRLMRMMAVKRQAEESQQDQIVINSLNLIDRGAGIDSIPVEEWSTLDSSKRNAIMGYLQAKSRGENKITDNRTYYQLKSAAADHPESFAQFNMADYQAKLSNADFREMVDLQQKVKKGEKDEKLLGFVENVKAVNSVLEAAGITDDDDKAEFYAVFDKETIGKNFSEIELKQLAKSKLTEVVTDNGIFWPTKKRLYQLTTEDVGALRIGDISEEDRSKIASSIKSNGGVASDENILKIYRLMLANQTGR